MSKLWETILNTFNFIGDNSGCHQIAERSFTIRGYTFPICARCTGVIIGEALAILFWVLGVKITFWLSIILAIIMLFDWGIQYIGVLESNNTRRFITGILGGYGCWSGLLTIGSYFFFLSVGELLLKI